MLTAQVRISAEEQRLLRALSVGQNRQASVSAIGFAWNCWVYSVTARTVRVSRRWAGATRKPRSRRPKVTPRTRGNGAAVKRDRLAACPTAAPCHSE